MAQGDLPTSRGGPLRRRREKRQLERLAAESEREANPAAATAHVKVIEDEAQAEKQEPEPGESSDAPPDAPAARPPGFQVRAVPIDEPFGE